MKNYDVMIIGAGATGLYSAINLDKDLSVAIFSKRKLTQTNSALAQGGIAAVLDTDKDNYENHIKDTLIAGSNQNDINSVKMLVMNGPENVKNLIKLGVDFDRKTDGELHMTIEGGHSKPRILHHKDSTGRAIVDTLIEEVVKYKNVDIIEEVHIVELMKTENGFSARGLLGDEQVTFNAHFCIIATGGIGRVYEYTTNSAISTGDGITFAYQMGAKIKNMSLVQFHPTAFAAKTGRERFLISEAIRGEGAFLLNCNYERFMDRYDARLELAPRDVVSKAIMLESKLTNSKNFYLDISFKDSKSLKSRFPMIYKCCKEEGVDITTDKIPVFPCQHYLMGGIDVDLDSKTTIDKLYAAGECSHTGVHGKNRLASNSLLEAVVYAKKAASSINLRVQKKNDGDISFEFPKDENTKLIKPGIRTIIREIIQNSCFVVPDIEKAKEGILVIKEILKDLNSGEYKLTPDFCEARSLATVAYLILDEVINKN